MAGSQSRVRTPLTHPHHVTAARERVWNGDSLTIIFFNEDGRKYRASFIGPARRAWKRRKK